MHFIYFPLKVLTITNTSTERIVFKVKTTQPTWYFVRPNQQLLDVGESEEVNVLLVDTECKYAFINTLFILQLESIA